MHAFGSAPERTVIHTHTQYTMLLHLHKPIYDYAYFFSQSPENEIYMHIYDHTSKLLFFSKTIMAI